MRTRDLLLAGCLATTVVASAYGADKSTPAAPPGRTLPDKNLIRNGDFKRPGLESTLPLYWLRPSVRRPTLERLIQYWQNVEAHDGVLTLRDGAAIRQLIDISDRLRGTYVLSGGIKIDSGRPSLTVCKMKGNDPSGRNGVGLSHFLVQKGRSESLNEWRKFRAEFKVERSDAAFNLRIVIMTGRDSVVHFRDLELKTTPPEQTAPTRPVLIRDGSSENPVKGICIEEKHSFYEARAARILRRFLYEMGDVYLPIHLVKDLAPLREQKGWILIGRATDASVETGGYQLASAAGSVYLGWQKQRAAKPASGELFQSDDGAVQGAYGLLRELGVKFYAPEEYVLPDAENLTIALDQQAVRNPALPYRFNDSFFFSQLGYSDHHLMPILKFAGLREVCTIHSHGVLLPVFKYFETHPEYYAKYQSGKPKGWPGKGLSFVHICLSNKKVQDTALESLLKLVEALPEAKFYGVGAADGSAWCECPDCRKMGTLAQRQARFLNMMAERVGEKYPDKLILGLFYYQWADYPADIELARNAIALYTTFPPTWKCYRHFLCPHNYDGMNQMLSWAKHAPDRTLALFYPGWEPASVFAEQVNFCGAVGFKGFYNNGHPGDMLRPFLAGRLSWAPSEADIVSAMREYFNHQYGDELAPFFVEYELLGQEARSVSRLCMHSQGVEHSMPFTGRPVHGKRYYAKANALLDEALASAKEQLDKPENLEGALREKCTKALKWFEIRKNVLLGQEVCEINKKTGALDFERDDFAGKLAKWLRAKREWKSLKLHWKYSPRDLIQRIAEFDIGNSVPWYDSPVLDEFFAAPVGFMKSKRAPYTRKGSALLFNVRALSGGELLHGYQYEGVPKSIREASRVLRRRGSFKSSVKVVFDLAEAPGSSVLLRLEGLDDEKPGVPSYRVLVNGKAVAVGEVPFKSDDWTWAEIRVPARVLQAGANSIEIKNTMFDSPGIVAEEQERSADDYTWGWFMVAGLELALGQP